MARTSTAWLTRLNAQGPVLLDGGTGSLLLERSGGAARYPVLFNLSAPDRVELVHREFVASGARIIVANSFCASKVYLEQLGLFGQVKELNRIAVRLARNAAAYGLSNEVLVAGSVAPVPRGTALEEQQQIFGEQMDALIESGVDLILCETFLDALQGLTAVRAAREVCVSRGMELPLVLSMVPRIDATARVGWDQIGGALAEGWLDLFGLNCGEGPLQAELCLAQLETGIFGPYWLKPSAGTATSPIDAASFGEEVGRMAKYFPTLAVGGCCGAGVMHLEAVNRALFGNMNESNCTDSRACPS